MRRGYVDFKEVKRQNEMKRNNSFKKFEPVDIIPATASRQERQKFEAEKRNRAAKRNKRRSHDAMIRRRVVTLSLSFALVFAGYSFISSNIQARYDRAYALEANNGDSYKYLESLGNNSEIKDPGVSYNQLDKRNDDYTKTDLGTRDNKPVSVDKYGTLTEKSSQYVRNLPVMRNINPSENNRIGKPVNGAVIRSTIGETITVKVTEDGENLLNMNLRKKSNVTAEQIDNVLRGTGLEGLGQAYKDAEREYNVNCLFLIGLSCLESDYGNSNFAKTRNNITGFRAYTEDPSKAIYYDTKADCIAQTARYLDKYYLTNGGKYYNGKSMLDVNTKYCTSSLWSTKINNIILTLFDKF